MQKRRIIKIDLTERTTNLNDLFVRFINVKKAQQMSERTISDYLETFNRFKKHYKATDINDLEQIKDDLLSFFVSLSNKAPTTYNKPYSNLNAFFNWCVKEKIITENPLIAVGLKKIRDEGKIRNIEEVAIKKLLDVMDLSTYVGFRDYCIVLLTMDTGIRPKEAFNILISDINFGSKILTIRKEVSKTRVSRVLPLSNQTIMCLEKLISFKPKDWLHNYIFYTIDGEQMNSHMWATKLNRLSKKIGYKITPYDLRHTFAIMFLRNGGNVFSLQSLLGHTEISMTKRYVNLAFSDVKNEHTKASPINNIVKRTTRINKLFK
jgi:site-specific recombinase XerD